MNKMTDKNKFDTELTDEAANKASGGSARNNPRFLCVKCRQLCTGERTKTLDGLVCSDCMPIKKNDGIFL